MELGQEVSRLALRLLVSSTEFLNWAAEEAPDKTLLSALGLSQAATSQRLQAWGKAFGDFKQQILDDDGRDEFQVLERHVRAVLRGKAELFTLVADGTHWFSCFSASGGFNCKVEDLGWMSFDASGSEDAFLAACVAADQMLLSGPAVDEGWAWRGEEAFAKSAGGWTEVPRESVRKQVAAHFRQASGLIPGSGSEELEVL